MESDLISRKALVKEILAEREKIRLTVVPRYGFGVPVSDQHGQSMRGGIRKALHCVETAPAVDAVEVVRCKDCEFGQKPTVCERLGTVVKPNDFCSRGVKKDAVD